MRYAIVLLALAAGIRAQDTGLTGVLSEEAFKKLHELSKEKRPPPQGKLIQLKRSKAYLSLPRKGESPFPAVLVIHEWWGLNRHIKYWCDRLAADGYAAMGVDLYDGKVAETRDDAMKYMRSVDEKKAVAVLEEAHQFLKLSRSVRATRRGCIGWCFGGGWSLKHAIEAPGVDAAVIYYGRLVTDVERLKSIKAPLLGVFANQDRGIPPKVVSDFETALGKARVEHKILRYDARHAFANPSSARYDAKAAEAAWGHVRRFLAAKLKQKGR
ncbi:MAG: dienelactone hydrolase family protein [Planctomycetota bacterium]|jgi:carboxymethylenebutenolidase